MDESFHSVFANATRYAEISSEPQRAIKVSARTIARMLGFAAFVMFLISLAIDTRIYLLDQSSTPQGVWLARADKWFNVDKESNLPTYFSMLLLLAAAVLLGLIGWAKWQAGNRFAAHWALLSLIFHCMAFDEIVQIHELLGEHLRRALGTTDYLYYAWVIPGMFLTIVLGCSFLRFLANLPGRFCILFVAAGAVYVSGVLGLELVESHLVSQHGVQHQFPLRFLTYSMQELLEMEGIVLFIYTLLEYLRWLAPAMRIEFERV